jgi:hypothetical protein
MVRVIKKDLKKESKKKAKKDFLEGKSMFLS